MLLQRRARATATQHRHTARVNVRDITDESGYISAIGQRAAAEAINRAKVEVAEQEREGAVGEAKAVRERNVRVSEERSLAEQGQKAAE